MRLGPRLVASPKIAVRRAGVLRTTSWVCRCVNWSAKPVQPFTSLKRSVISTRGNKWLSVHFNSSDWGGTSDRKGGTISPPSSSRTPSSFPVLQPHAVQLAITRQVGKTLELEIEGAPCLIEICSSVPWNTKPEIVCILQRGERWFRHERLVEWSEFPAALAPDIATSQPVTQTRQRGDFLNTAGGIALTEDQLAYLGLQERTRRPLRQ